jgi:hypothetical protein
MNSNRDDDGVSIRELQRRQDIDVSPQQQQQNNEQYDMEELAKDISYNLNDNESFDDSDNKEDLTFSLPYDFKDPLLLLIIYFILSQAVIRQFFGNYISFINPGEDGVVSQIGIIIYGSIMILLFMLIKKFI